MRSCGAGAASWSGWLFIKSVWRVSKCRASTEVAVMGRCMLCSCTSPQIRAPSAPSHMHTSLLSMLWRPCWQTPVYQVHLHTLEHTATSQGRPRHGRKSRLDRGWDCARACASLCGAARRVWYRLTATAENRWPTRALPSPFFFSSAVSACGGLQAQSEGLNPDNGSGSKSSYTHSCSIHAARIRYRGTLQVCIWFQLLSRGETWLFPIMPRYQWAHSTVAFLSLVVLSLQRTIKSTSLLSSVRWNCLLGGRHCFVSFPFSRTNNRKKTLFWGDELAPWKQILKTG